MKPNIKPCPFCGKKAKYVHMNFIEDTHSVFCNDCSFSFDSGNKDELIKRWNTRHDEMTIKKLILLIVNIVVYSFALSCLLAVVYQICLFFKP